jgi:predicted GNAT superfamily acetyltransferase
MTIDEDGEPCRRKNYVHAAYVEAAIHINKTLGSDRAYWMLIREKVPSAVIDRILKGKEGRIRQRDRRYATRRATIQGPQPEPLSSDRRVDHLTSQRIEVALVFQEMLGADAAADYLRNAGIPVWVATRVLESAKRRPTPALVPE